MSKIYRIGSRASQMALAQTELVANAIKSVKPDFEYEVVKIATTGDKFMGDLSKVGGKGAFVKEIEVAMLDGSIDLAMHSMKDVPNDTELPEGLISPATLKRNDIRDVVVCREGDSFEGLKEGAKVGTSSLRRGSQIKAFFPNLNVVPLRGNVNTRLAKLDAGEIDCAILAKAGLERIGLGARIGSVFEPDMMLPAVGQGAVGVECKADDAELLEILKQINHQDTFTCVAAERALAKALNGSCHTPIAGYCQVTKGGSLRLLALVAAPDGSKVIRARHKMPYDDPQAIGIAAAEDLLSQGAKELIESL